MQNKWACLGVVAALAGACAADSGIGSSGGTGAFGGVAGSAATGGLGATGGTGGFAAVGGSGGYAAVGGGGGWGGYAAVGGTGGTAGTVAADGGMPCVPGVICGPQGPDDDGCGTLTLPAEIEEVIVPGNLLLIFDRSGSMNNDWNGMPRWQAAGTAMVSALSPIVNNLTIGAVLFPSPAAAGTAPMCAPNDFLCMFGLGSLCGVNAINAADQISFKTGPAALAELMGPPPEYQPVAAGATPTTEGVRRADEAINAAQLTGTTAVVLITDGDPNCAWDQAATVGIITAWAARGIKTYVVGLPGLGGNGQAILSALAQAGGTAPYLTPSDGAQLQQQMAAIVSSTISTGFNSCSITINPPTQAPDELQLVVTQNGMELGVGRDLGTGGGWSITPDGAQVEIFGQLCEEAKNGAYTSLEFKFGCVNLPPLPPPMPPD